MASPQTTTRREEVLFPPNTAVVIALKYAQGKRVSGMSGERVMYTTLDNRVMFLDLEVAAQIEALAVNVRENFTLTRHWDGRKDSPVAWTAARVHGQQPNGTFTVPAALAGESSDARSLAAPKTAASATVAETAAIPRKPVASAGLVCEAESLVDAYAEVLRRALDKHQGLVKTDDVKTLVITAYIQRQKLSSVA